MNPGILDHLIAFTIIAILPISAMWNFPRMAAKVRADPGARLSAYKAVIAQQWLFAAIVVGLWFALGRERAALGLDLPPGLPSIIGLAITAALVTTLHLQTGAQLRGGEAARETLRAQIGATEVLIPRTPLEARWFRGLAVTAGVCEEVLYRGFLIAYLGALFGTWPAVAAGAAVFGLGHIYQSRANALKGAILALLLGVLYLGCGSLLWPMILHAAIDHYSGVVARDALVEKAPAP